MSTALRLIGAATLCLAVAMGCSNEPVGPTPAVVEVTLSTPVSDAGAMLFTISGGPVEAIERTGYTLYFARIDSHTLRAIVTGNLQPGPVARIRIADERQLSRYSATIDQVATPSSYSQRNPAGYALTLNP
jgi:hypothetical protein